jgi:hypothetical protein
MEHRLDALITGSRMRSPRIAASVDFPEPGTPLINIATGSLRFTRKSCQDEARRSRVAPKRKSESPARR